MAEDILVQFRASPEEVKKLDEVAKEESRSRAGLLQYILANLSVAMAAIHKEKSSAS